jgi:hypothetical protein
MITAAGRNRGRVIEQLVGDSLKRMVFDASSCFR